MLLSKTALTVVALLSALIYGEQSSVLALDDSCENGTCSKQTDLISSVRGKEIGSSVTVQAVVVGDYQNGDEDDVRDLGGFWLQEEKSDEDGDVATSEAIFVYDARLRSSPDVALGNTVRVSGEVSEHGGAVQIRPDDVVVVDDFACAVTGLEIDACLENLVNIVVVPSLADARLERFEGMLVEFSEKMMISNAYELGRFDRVELFAGDSLPYVYTQQNDPSKEGYEKHIKDVEARTIVYSSGHNQQNRGVTLDGFSKEFNEETSNRNGDVIQGLRGNLQYSQTRSKDFFMVRSYRDGLNTFDQEANDYPREYHPPETRGNLKIASINVLNFFKTLGQGDNKTKTGQNPRGANNSGEFARQLSKLVNAIVAMDADVVGILEMENEFDPVQDKSTAIEILVDALNKEYSSDLEETAYETYKYVYPGRENLETDAIAVACLYKPGSVFPTPGSSPAILNDAVASTLGFDTSEPIFDGPSTNRWSLAVSFTHRQSRKELTVFVNHLKSKRCSGTSGDNEDKNDGAGCYNARRLRAAEVISKWVKSWPTGVQNDNGVILGDFNAYAREDPVRYMVNKGGLINLEPDTAYSYTFSGQIGTLDYVLVTKSVMDFSPNAHIWHCNSLEPPLLDYNLDYRRDSDYLNDKTAIRYSDHDPALLGLTLM